MFKYRKEYQGLINALNQNRIKSSLEVLSPAVVKSQFEQVIAIIFEVTEGCNLSCEYCGFGENYRETKYRPQGRGINLEWSSAKPLIDYYLSLWEASSVSDFYISFYGGEPLLNFKIVQQITDYIEKEKLSSMKIHYHLTTNGVLLLKHIDYFVEHDFSVSISLDGDEKANIFRVDKSGHPTFQIVDHNVRTIQEKYPSYFAEKISFQAVVTRNSSVLDVYRYFDEQYHQRPLALEVSSEGLADDNNIQKYYLDLKQDIASNYSDNVVEYDRYDLQNPRHQSFESAVKTMSFSYNNDYFRLLDRGEYMGMKSPTCKPIGGRIYLSSTGLLYQCEKVKFDFPIGQVAEGKVRLDFEGIASQFNKILANYENQCRSCLHQLNCHHCMATSYGYSEDGHKCDGFEEISEKNLKKYVSSIRDYLKSNAL